MPSYTVLDNKTGKSEDVFCSYEKLKKKLKNKRFTQVFGMNIVAGVGHMNSKTDNGFKDVLRRVQSGAGKGNTIKI